MRSRLKSNDGSGPYPILTTAPDSSHAAQIIYGLELRGIHARIVDNPTESRDSYAVALISGDKERAESAIEVIWDTLLDATPRAMDIHGHCFFCGYDTTGLPAPVICPECGHNLDSIESRRIASRGQIDGR
ncbi:MAG: hypothetical protein AB8C13_05100 [Phycisphaerales bacterium]